MSGAARRRRAGGAEFAEEDRAPEPKRVDAPRGPRGVSHAIRLKEGRKAGKEARGEKPSRRGGRVIFEPKEKFLAAAGGRRDVGGRARRRAGRARAGRAGAGWRASLARPGARGRLRREPRVRACARARAPSAHLRVHVCARVTVWRAARRAGEVKCSGSARVAPPAPASTFSASSRAGPPRSRSPSTATSSCAAWMASCASTRSATRLCTMTTSRPRGEARGEHDGAGAGNGTGASVRAGEATDGAAEGARGGSCSPPTAQLHDLYSIIGLPSEVLKSQDGWNRGCSEF